MAPAPRTATGARIDAPSPPEAGVAGSPDGGPDVGPDVGPDSVGADSVASVSMGAILPSRRGSAAAGTGRTAYGIAWCWLASSGDCYGNDAHPPAPRRARRCPRRDPSGARRA